MKSKRRPQYKEKIFRGQKDDPQNSYATGIPLPDIILREIDAFRNHPWVYKAIAHIAADYASVPLEVLRPNGKDFIPETTNIFSQKLLRQPNPYMSFYDIQELTAISLECAGNAYWGLERSSPGGEIIEMWPLPTENVRAVSSKTQLISGYILDVGGKRIEYDVNDIIHQKYSSPFSMIYGQGSLTASRNTIESDLYAEKWNQVFFKNSARPDAIVEVDRTLGPGERRRMKQSWMEMYGGTTNSKKLAILEKGMKYTPLDTKHTDMEFNELRKQAREIIIGSIGVPPSVLGILEFANFANMREQTQVYWKYTMLPKIRRRDQTLSMRLNQLMFRNDLVVRSDLSGVEALRDDELTRSKVVRSYWDMGVPLNRLIDTFELPFDHVPGGDIPKPLGSPDASGDTVPTTNNGKSA